MTQQTDVTVLIDDRMRLVSAALAATEYPEKAQERKRYFAHAHARGTTKYLFDKGLQSHPAIQGFQTMLNEAVPLERIYALVMHLPMPGLAVKALPPWVPVKWNQQLWDFYEKAQLETYWKTEGGVWDKALTQSKSVFQNRAFKPFLENFIGTISQEFVFEPNICYPAEKELGVTVHNQIHAVIPPAQAWGDSPPLPYNEDTMITHPIRGALTRYAVVLLSNYLRSHSKEVAEASKKELPVTDQFKALHPSWEEQFVELFVAGAVAIYLEDYVSSLESKAFVKFETKARGMTILPGTINVLRRYLQEVGNRYSNLLEFLPIFPVQLRVAKKIVTF